MVRASIEHNFISLFKTNIIFIFTIQYIIHIYNYIIFKTDIIFKTV